MLQTVKKQVNEKERDMKTRGKQRGTPTSVQLSIDAVWRAHSATHKLQTEGQSITVKHN